MRRLVTALGTYLSIACIMPAWAHGDADELGHHWEIAKYRSEMWFQILVMAAVMAVYVAGVFLVREWKRRRSLL